MRIPIVTGTIILFVAAAAYADEKAESHLERMLRGARIGVAFDAFIDAHPEAVYSDEERRDEPVSPREPGALLVVHETDPFLGLYSFANFGFRGGVLYELVAVWSAPPEIIQSRLDRFFEAVLKRHGRAFQRKSMLVLPGSPEERAVALWYWEGEDAVTLAFYTPPLPGGTEPEQGVLTYAQFRPTDPFLKDILTRLVPSREQHEQVWRELAARVDVLE